MVLRQDHGVLHVVRQVRVLQSTPQAHGALFVEEGVERGKDVFGWQRLTLPQQLQLGCVRRVLNGSNELRSRSAQLGWGQLPSLTIGLGSPAVADETIDTGQCPDDQHETGPLRQQPQLLIVVFSDWDRH
uniref:(northern house mosquito) hypothetical protein n=1 Tax=Culex pipiens TaxID=7175 RepID=A0A8D8G167_CULPI